MFRPFLTAALLGVACLAPIGAADAGNLDGTWVGRDGGWTITLTVHAATADLTLQCEAYTPFHLANIAVSPKGNVDLVTPRGLPFASRRIHGQLPQLTIDPVGACGTAVATLKHQA